MTAATAVIAVCGALVGVGLFLLIREIKPPPPSLDEVITRLDRTAPPPSRGLGGWLVVRLRGLPIPRKDLALLGRSPEQFLLHKAGLALAGLTGPTLLGLALPVIGAELPVTVSVGAALIAGVGLFWLPDHSVRAAAAKRRDQFRSALITYIDLVALARAAGAHPNKAIAAAAGIGDTWPFHRLSAVIDQASRAQLQPWAGLARLGEQVDVPQLVDLADIAELAGAHGASVLDTLTATAESMRNQSLSAARSRANANTTTMVVPIFLLALGYIILLVFPVIHSMSTI